jgi:beta-D-galactosyl-(1->4)-L-rhamnose phosphorylase
MYNKTQSLYLTDNAQTECAYFPSSKNMVVINNSEKVQQTTIKTDAGEKEFVLQPYETQFADV